MNLKNEPWEDILSFWTITNIAKPLSISSSSLKIEENKLKSFIKDKIFNVDFKKEIWEVNLGRINNQKIINLFNEKEYYHDKTSTLAKLNLEFKRNSKNEVNFSYLSGTIKLSNFLFIFDEILARKITKINKDINNIHFSNFVNALNKTIDEKCDYIFMKEFGLEEKYFELEEFQVKLLNFLKKIKESILDKIQTKEIKAFVEFLIYMGKWNEDKLDLPNFFEKGLIELKESLKKNKSEEFINFIEANKKNEMDNPKSQNRDFLEKITDPKNLSLAKWPSKHNLSFMQLVSLNVFLTKPNKIFSVNGPPGTGKTTLLKEVFANLIFEKANFINQHEKNGKSIFQAINQDNEEWNYYSFKEEFFKTNIIVSSSTNNAVENITKEFSNNDENFSKHKGYFEDFLNQSKTLSKNTWGLLSFPLGKQENWKKLMELFQKKDGKFYFKIKKDNLDFEKSLKDFEKTSQKVKDLKTRISGEYENIKENFHFIKTFKNKTTQKVNHLNTLIKKLKQLNLEKIRLQKLIDSENQKMTFLEKIKRIFFISKIWKEISKNKNLLKRNIQEIEKTEQEKEFTKEEIFNLEQERQDKIKSLQIYQKVFGKSYAYPSIDEAGNIKNDFFEEIINSKSNNYADNHLVSPWQNEELDKERENLFFSALNLIQEFILSKKYGQKIKTNLKELFDEKLGKNFHNSPEKTKHLLTTVNLLIPIISTTLHSSGKMFENFKENEIGNVFIDEAGQVEPLTAINLLYKAKKALILGDPQQLEVVLDLKTTLLKELGKFFKIPNLFKDEKLSLQNLADYQNEYYEIINKEKVGTTLIVHRRCQNPMFEISNKISYDNRMVQVVLPKSKKNKYIFSKSKFQDVKSSLTTKSQNHFIKEQYNFLMKEIEKATKTPEELEKELFIISPFKSVEKELKKLLRKEQKNRFTDKFIKNNVGTVHTFQGKEASEVVLLLGCDRNSEGAINWVAKNANLLNVAVTRAKNRIVIIGEKNLWHERKYFKDAIEILEKNSNFTK